MDERFRAIYEAIYAQTVQPPEPQVRIEGFERFGQPPGPVFGPSMQEAIADAERLRVDGARLREDAKALLAMNFTNLVFLPLAVGGEDIAVVENDVRRDTAMLVAESEVDRSRRVPEITGHAVIDALSHNWAALRISRFRLWERSGE
jgi:hypothetical protein